MRNTMKVAKWEVKRNLKNKSFLIGMFLTPLLMLGGYFIFQWIGSTDVPDDDAAVLLVHDELGVFEQLEAIVAEQSLSLELEQSDLLESEAEEVLTDKENMAYMAIDKRILDNATVPVYTSEDMGEWFNYDIQALAEPIQQIRLAQLSLSEEELAMVTEGVQFEEHVEGTLDEGTANEEDTEAANILENLVPGIFAGIILLSIVFTGMMIFQSASQEKKDKIAEIILSSVKPEELMQGKIIGYFVLGIIQVAVFLALVMPVAVWKIDFPIIEYLLTPKLLLLLLIAVLGYLLFAAIFVGIGATMADISTAGNFQGMIMMLPFLPVLFIGPVIEDPSGFMAQLGSYIPFSAPGVLLLRLSFLETWPWMEIGIALLILAISVWFFMKMAGRIFKTGILMYGKNATPKEIWKWMFID
ncbi:ABC transporter permease [Ornithinibacillus gellani]|uniref:ABC transporter permease n=1 Tax=Ornithinibacillus gellani TaxID=2293253 RepID=UPI000F471C98|nr:ABC transporter permease [Ornithinibacillus gellani]TQS72032.1 ABC transporter permease [Ornithinibacillus gellani]